MLGLWNRMTIIVILCRDPIDTPFLLRVRSADYDAMFSIGMVIRKFEVLDNNLAAKPQGFCKTLKHEITLTNTPQSSPLRHVRCVDGHRQFEVSLTHSLGHLLGNVVVRGFLGCGQSILDGPAQVPEFRSLVAVVLKSIRDSRKKMTR